MALITFDPIQDGTTPVSAAGVNPKFQLIYDEFNGNITAANIANSAVTNPKIANDAVTTAKILDENVTTPKVADGAITPIKTTFPSGRIYFPTTGSTGGQVISATTLTTLNFSVLDPDSVDVTSPANGVLQANTKGFYKVQVTANISDSPQSQRLRLEVSTDSGSNWTKITPAAVLSGFASGEGAHTSALILLDVGHQVRSRIFTGATSRIAAADAAEQKYTASLAMGI